MAIHLLNNDRAIGVTLLSLGSLIFAYYTFWVIFMPLLPQTSVEYIMNTSLFPSNGFVWSIAVPITAFTGFVAFVFIFVFISSKT